MLGDGGRLGGSSSKPLVLVTTTTTANNVLHIWGRGDVIMMSLVGPRVISSLKLGIHVLCTRILE